jgi:bifunctional DNA-binding transcriptional regulator/antitoxin component of YhaV-PrlF toxin-antitoxin module
MLLIRFINYISHLNGFKMGKERLYKKGLTIDDRNRIVIPAELLEELKLKSREKVSVYADFEKNKIIIKKGGKNEKKL